LRSKTFTADYVRSLSRTDVDWNFKVGHYIIKESEIYLRPDKLILVFIYYERCIHHMFPQRLIWFFRWGLLLCNWKCHLQGPCIQVKGFVSATAILNSFNHGYRRVSFICSSEQDQCVQAMNSSEREVESQRANLHCSGPIIEMPRCHHFWKLLTWCWQKTKNR
jgi:hypothetical protein